jgi:hypothetical protein
MWLWFVIIVLLLALAVAAYVIWDLQKTKSRAQKHNQELQNTVVLIEQKGAALYEKIEMLQDQNEDLKYQRDAVQRMVELGFLSVSEDNVVTKDKIVARMSERKGGDDNILYLGRHA